MKKISFYLIILLHLGLLQNIKTFGQSTVANGTGFGHTWTANTDFVGWSNGIGPLDFQNNGIVNMQMTTGGMVGIGSASIPPSFQLDVMDAININTSTFSAATTFYMINAETVLHNFGAGNIFSGVGAGNFTLTGGGNSCFGFNTGSVLTTGYSNIFLGNGAGNANTTGKYNVMIGYTAGQDNVSGENNTFVGTRSGELNLGDNNTYLGFYSGLVNTTGTRNTFAGASTGINNTVDDNTFIGYNSGTANTSGANNTFTGSHAGQANTAAADNTFTGFNSGVLSTGSQNTFLGSQTGLANISGEGNTFVGYLAGSVNTNGRRNTFVGINSSLANTTGSNNTFIGNSTAGSNTVGSYNTVLGDAANCAATLSHQTAIGDGAIATTGSTIIIGNNYNTGIGLSNVGGPLRMLEVHRAGDDPQLRLSNDYGATGTYTDFETTTAGDLIIRPRNNTTQRRVGINTSSPNTTLEINSPASSPTAGGGNSGLQFTDLTTASTINPSSFTGTPKGVLSVDGNGKVVLVSDEVSGTGTVTACTTGGGTGLGTVNWITKFVGVTDICNSGIWESPTSPNNIGIGTTSPLSTLHIVSPASSPPDYTAFVYNNTSTSSISGAIRAEIHTTAAANTRGVYVVADGGTNTNYGIDVFTSGSSTKNYGAALRASNATQNYGVNSEAIGNNTANYGGFFSATGSAFDNYGIQSSSAGTGTSNFGVKAISASGSGGTSTNNYALYGESRGITGGTGTNYAAYLDAAGTATANYGLKSKALGAVTNYAIHASTTSATNATDNFGVYTTANSATNNYAVYAVTSTSAACATGTSCTQAAGYFAGDVYCTTNSYWVSDSTIKSNITPLSNSIGIINQLNPRSYTFDTAAAPGVVLASGIQYGLLAQEVETILPSLVKEVQNAATLDSLGNTVFPAMKLKAINYTSLIPFLIGGIKDQQLQIDSLRQLILSCCGIVPRSGNIGGNTKNIERIELKNSQSIILDQNKPNPFAELTDIDYFLPEEVISAEMIFYNQTGMVLKTVSLNEKGKGTVRVYSPELKNGTYLYTLLVDGKVIETKTMIKAK